MSHPIKALFEHPKFIEFIISLKNKTMCKNETIEISRDNVTKAYANAPSAGKKLLEDLFGRRTVASTVMDRVKTFEDACIELQLFVTDATPKSYLRGIDDKPMVALQKLLIIAAALNQGWKPDWENSNEYKWYPWFKMQGGFGFSVSYCTDTYSFTDVGSRLCFKSEELANYAGKQFESIYKDYLIF